MTDTEIFEDLKKIIQKQFRISEDKIEEDSYFDSDLNISDLEIEDLISTVQKKYNITIAEQEAPQIKKVSDLTTYIFENVDSAS